MIGNGLDFAADFPLAQLRERIFVRYLMVCGRPAHVQMSLWARTSPLDTCQMENVMESWAVGDSVERQFDSSETDVSDGVAVGTLIIMISICAHVPMSLRARTSVPDPWSVNKGIKRNGYGVMNVLTGITGWRLLYLWFSACSCSPIQFVIKSGLSTCVWRLWYPVGICVALYFTTSFDQWETPRRPTGFCCKLLWVCSCIARFQ